MAKSFKKWLLISIILIILLVTAVLAYAFFNANKLIASFKPQLEQQLSKVLDTKISLGEITASIFPETAFKIRSLELGQANKNITDTKFDELLVKLDLSQLLQKKLAVTEISIKAPQAKFKKLAGQEPTTKVSESPEKKSGNPQQPAPAAASPLEIDLKSFKIEDGHFEFEDAASGKQYFVSKLNVSSGMSVQGKDVKLNDLKLALMAMDKVPFSLSVPSLDFTANKVSIAEFITYLAEQKLSGNAGFNLDSKSGELQLSSEGLNLADLIAAAANIQPGLPPIPAKGQIAPNIHTKIKGSELESNGTLGLKNISVSQGQFNISELNGDIGIQANTPDKAELQSSGISFKLNDQPGTLTFKARHQDKKINLSDLNLNFLGGKLKSTLNFTPETKSFSTQTQASDLQIASMLDLIKKSELPLTGNVSQFNANLQGTLTDKPLSSTQGPVNVTVANGAIKGFNLAGIVLKAVNNLPFLAGSLYSSLPADQKAAFDSSDTAFSSFTSNLNLTGSGINVQSINLVSPTFIVDAKGSVSPDMDLALKANIYFSQALSNMLVSSSPNLKYGLDSQGRLTLPLSISGKASSIQVLPDVQKLVESSGKKVLQEKATEAATEFLKKKGLGGLLGF